MQVPVLRSMGLKEEAYRALVTGTQTYPDSHTLWLLRLRNERSGGREEGGEGEERECASLIQLCSEATKAVPAEVSLCESVSQFSVFFLQNSLSLWQFWLEVLISSDTPDSEVDATFQVVFVRALGSAVLSISHPPAPFFCLAPTQLYLKLQFCAP